jgi:hypothetical protein
MTPLASAPLPFISTLTTFQTDQGNFHAGIAGGPVLESVNGHERAFIALVGWESVAVHEAYHHTRHFREEGRKVLLEPAKGGYAYYGHIGFTHAEEKGGGRGGRVKL